jgi:hypothetical protein
LTFLSNWDEDPIVDPFIEFDGLIRPFVDLLNATI